MHGTMKRSSFRKSSQTMIVPGSAIKMGLLHCIAPEQWTTTTLKPSFACQMAFAKNKDGRLVNSIFSGTVVTTLRSSTVLKPRLFTHAAVAQCTPSIS